MPPPFVAGLLKTPSGVGILGMLVAVTTVAVALAYAIRPGEHRLALMRPLSLATIFSALCTFTVGIASVLLGVGATAQVSAETWPRIAIGMAEAFVPLFGAFGCLAVAWLMVTFGMRKGA